MRSGARKFVVVDFHSSTCAHDVTPSESAPIFETLIIPVIKGPRGIPIRMMNHCVSRFGRHSGSGGTLQWCTL